MINAAMAALIEELGDEIPDILTAEFSLACLWTDLCRIAGEPVPRDVAAVLDAPLDLAPVPAYRGSYAAHGAPFPTYAD
jgi:hypothetical protein